MVMPSFSLHLKSFFNYSGRNLFPATGYLILVWESFAIMLDKLLSEMKVVFEDVKYIRASNIPNDGSLELTVTIQTGTQVFEVNCVVTLH